MANTPPVQRKPNKKKSNPLKAGQNIDYKDVNTLRKFISERGKIRARRVTGLSVQEQRMVAIATFRCSWTDSPVTRRARILPRSEMNFRNVAVSL